MTVKALDYFDKHPLSSKADPFQMCSTCCDYVNVKNGNRHIDAMRCDFGRDVDYTRWIHRGSDDMPLSESSLSTEKSLREKYQSMAKTKSSAKKNQSSSDPQRLE